MTCLLLALRAPDAVLSLLQAIAKARQSLSQYIVGQRVRLADGRVGTVANIKIAGATAAQGPGILVRLTNQDGIAPVFAHAHEITPYEYGTHSTEVLLASFAVNIASTIT